METQIKFKRSQLANYAVITLPGKYELEVASDVSPDRLIIDEDGSNARHIVNLKAVASDKLDQLKAAFGNKTEINIEQTNGCFMTANVWKREGQNSDLPMKGETVDAIVDYVTPREGEEKVLRITSLKRKPSKVAQKISLNEFFGVEAPAATEQAAVKTLEHA